MEKMSGELQRLIPKSQLAVMRDSEEFDEAVKSMNSLVEKLPYLGKTDMKRIHPVFLHYFVGGSDWYITEWDRKDLFFGYAILNGDYEMSEWGYISRDEILSLEFPQKFLMVNLDLYCTDVSIEAALFRKNREYFWRYAPNNKEE